MTNVSKGELSTELAGVLTVWHEDSHLPWILDNFLRVSLRLSQSSFAVLLNGEKLLKKAGGFLWKLSAKDPSLFKNRSPRKPGNKEPTASHPDPPPRTSARQAVFRAISYFEIKTWRPKGYKKICIQAPACPHRCRWMHTLLFLEPYQRSAFRTYFPKAGVPIPPAKQQIATSGLRLPTPLKHAFLRTG